MPITILAVGRKHEDWVADGIERYQKRLKTPFIVKWVLLPHSSYEGERARQEESERLISRLDARAYVVLLDENGKTLDSPQLSKVLVDHLDKSEEIVLIIGGAYGVDESVHSRANFVWSLSPLVFPHQLVRLILIEQLYRTQQISLGGSYHHE